MTEGCAFVDTIEREIRNRISEDIEEPIDGPEPLDRRSPLGLFFRTLLIKLRKMSFHETLVLSAHAAEWCGVRGEPRRVGMSLNREVREGGDKRVAAMASHQAAAQTGDYGSALFALRQFYDYQVPSSDRYMHQHALLNLAAFKYATGGLDAAREAVEEGIRLSRQQGDKTCLESCLSLKYRLTTEVGSAAWAPNEVPRVKGGPLPERKLAKGATPSDELWSINAAVDLGESAPMAYRRLWTALNSEKAGTEENVPRMISMSAWHQAQAGLWGMMGSGELADLHESMALTAPDLEEEGRITILLARAERSATAGKFDEALALLLDPGVLEGLSLTDYRRWASVVWSIVEKEATLEEDAAALSVLAGLRAPAPERTGPGGLVRDKFDLEATPESRGILSAQEHIRDSLKQARSMLDKHTPAHLILPIVLSALQLAQSLALWPLHDEGIVALSEVLLQMELWSKADKEVAAFWPRLGGELGARAALVRAKAHAALALEQEGKHGARDTFNAATKYAKLAKERGQAIGAARVVEEAEIMSAMLAELAGGRGKIPARKQGTLSEKVRGVGEVVRLVGVRVAEGWR